MQDYARSAEGARLASDQRFVTWLKRQLSAFDPNHDSPLGVEPPPVTWPVSTAALNGCHFGRGAQMHTRDLFEVPADTRREQLAPGAWLLHGFAHDQARVLLAAVKDIETPPHFVTW